MRNLTNRVADVLKTIPLGRDALLAASPRKLAKTLRETQEVSKRVADILRSEAGNIHDRPAWIKDEGWDARPIVVQSAVHYAARFAEEFAESAEAELVVGDLRRGTFTVAHRDAINVVEEDARSLLADLRRDFASDWWHHNDTAYYERLEDLDVACETYLNFMYYDLSELTSALETLRQTGRLNEKPVHWTDRPQVKTAGWLLGVVAVVCAVASVPFLAARCTPDNGATTPAVRAQSTIGTDTPSAVPAVGTQNATSGLTTSSPGVESTAAGQGQ